MGLEWNPPCERSLSHHDFGWMGEDLPPGEATGLVFHSKSILTNMVNEIQKIWLYKISEIMLQLCLNSVFCSSGSNSRCWSSVPWEYWIEFMPRLQFVLCAALFLFAITCPLAAMSASPNTLYVRTKSRFSVRPAGAAWMFLPGCFPGTHQTVTEDWEWRLSVHVCVFVCVCLAARDVVAARQGRPAPPTPQSLHLDRGGLSFRSAGPEQRSKLHFNRSYSQ